MINVTVKGRSLIATALRPITAGSVGLPVVFSFSNDWDSYQKIAVFKGSDTMVDVALINTTECVVPSEVLVNSGENLWIGVYGSDPNTGFVIPTIWGKAGHIYDGTEPSGVDPSEPTPSWVAQVQAAAASALEKAEAVEAAAAAGDFDGADGADGVSPSVSQTQKLENWQIPGVLSNSRNGFALSVTDANGTITSPDIYEAWPLKINAIKSGDTTTVKLYTSSSTADATLTIKDGADGQDGADGLNGAGAYLDENGYIHIVPGSAGTGVPPGGTAGQILVKATNSDYETEWADLPVYDGGVT